MTHAPTIDLACTPLEDTFLFHFPTLAAIDGFRHVITSRPWNVATHCGPDVALAVGRRRRVCQAIGLSFDGLTAADQVHSPHVVRIGASDVGAGREGRHTALRFVDGMVCDLPGVALMQFSADCPIVLLVEPRRRIVGTAHASWRGTVAGITGELVRQLRREFGVDPAGLVGGICPCAGPSAYEVGEEVRRVAAARLADGERFFHRRDGTWRFDLRAANEDQLVRAGMHAAQLSVASNCTLSDPRFFSHRRDGADTGRFALIAGFAATVG